MPSKKNRLVKRLTVLQKVAAKYTPLTRFGTFFKPVTPFSSAANNAVQAHNSSSKPVAKPTVTSKVVLDATPKPSGKCSRRVKYPLKKHLNWSVCFKLAQKYKLAVYQTKVGGPEAKSKAVKAIFHHKQD